MTEASSPLAASSTMGIQAQIQQAGESIFRAPETFSDLIVVSSAMIALAIAVTYIYSFVTKLLARTIGAKDKQP